MIFYQDGLLFLYFTYLHEGFLTLGLTYTSPPARHSWGPPPLPAPRLQRRWLHRPVRAGMAVTPKELCSSAFPIFSCISLGEAQRSFPKDCLQPIVLGSGPMPD